MEKAHHTIKTAAMRQSESVTEFVNRFLLGPRKQQPPVSGQ